MSSALPRGTFVPDLSSSPVVRLKTARIGLMTLDLQAPITSGRLHLTARTSTLQLHLNLAEVQVGNRLMQSAARSLVGSGDSSRLVFDAKGSADDLLQFDGMAQAGDVLVPMEVSAHLGPLSHELPVTLTGWARFTDVSIPMPGMSRVNTIEVDVSARLSFLTA